MLKIIQETYLGQVKIIYIDPPYNTGKDFIYKDDFKEKHSEYDKRSSQRNENDDRLVSNIETSGRFHSDWLSMMLSRLKVARNLLTEDGVIFISIDDSEVYNLRKLCSEIFGEENFIGMIVVKGNASGRDYGGIARTHDYLLSYSKTKISSISKIDNPDKFFPHRDGVGEFEVRELRNRNITFNSENRPNLFYPFYLDIESEDDDGFFNISLDRKSGWKEVWPKKSQGFQTVWRWGKNKSEQNLNINIVGKKNRNGGYQIVEKYRETSRMVRSIWDEKNMITEKGTLMIKDLFGSKIFDFPKTVDMIQQIIKMIDSNGEIVLDFFAGSSTTAHAVMQTNSEDGGNRRFIMVQIPEICNEKSEAAREGYKTIADISKERIRLAGEKIIKQECHSDWNRDIGFRVLKVDTSNMKNFYYMPSQISQKDLLDAVDNIKSDRTHEDLLFQVLINWGIDMTLKISSQIIQDKKVFFVDDHALIACFDAGITEEFVKELASRKPLRVVFRDGCFVSDSVKINVDQIFKQFSPETNIKVI